MCFWSWHGWAFEVSLNAFQPMRWWLKLILTTKGWIFKFLIFSRNFLNVNKFCRKINFQFVTYNAISWGIITLLLSSLYEIHFSLWWQNHPPPTSTPFHNLILIPSFSAHVIHQTTVETDAKMTFFESKKIEREKYFSHKFPLRVFSL